MAQDGTPAEGSDKAADNEAQDKNAQDESKPPAKKSDEPFTWGRQKIPDAHPSVRVRLEQGGQLQIEIGSDDWKNVSLKELGAQLRLRADLYDKERRAQGKSGWIRYGLDMDVSSMRVLLEAHEDAQWKHAKQVMMVMVEQHFSRLAFVEGNRIVDASFPIDGAIGLPRKRFLLSVLVFRARTADGGLGPVEFRFANRSSSSLKDVSKWMAEAVKRAPAGLRVEGRELRLLIPTGFVELLLGEMLRFC